MATATQKRPPVVLVDREETRGGLLKNQAIALFVALGVAPLLVWLALHSAGSHHMDMALKQAGGALLCFGGGLLIFRMERGTAQRAKPGELRLPQLPLLEGETVSAAYTRPVDPSCRLNRLSARLVMEREERKRESPDEVYRRWAYCGHTELGDGDARIVNGELVAVWRFEVPNPHLEQGIGHQHFRFSHGEHRWRFVVELDVEGLPDSESSFPITLRQTGANGWKWEWLR